MTTNNEDKSDSFEFDSSGEEIQYMSLMKARLFAIRHARENTDIYGPRLSQQTMVWDLSSAEEDDEDYYRIILTFRPAGKFLGTPGLEEFIIDKGSGAIELRQILDEPTWVEGEVPQLFDSPGLTNISPVGVELPVSANRGQVSPATDTGGMVRAGNILR